MFYKIFVFLFNSVCTAGSWVCTKKFCSRTCSVLGTNNIHTFDGKSYSVRGNCEYILVEVSTCFVRYCIKIILRRKSIQQSVYMWQWQMLTHPHRTTKIWLSNAIKPMCISKTKVCKSMAKFEPFYHIKMMKWQSHAKQQCSSRLIVCIFIYVMSIWKFNYI